MQHISEALVSQFNSVWSMLEQTIDNTPDDKWHKGVGEWFFSLTVYHVIETAEFYTREDSEGMSWGGRAGFQWDNVKNIETDVLPKVTQELVRSYLTDVKLKFIETLQSFSNEEYSQPGGFGEYIPTRLEKFIYLLRHFSHHIGELNRTLREWNCNYTEWE